MHLRPATASDLSAILDIQQAGALRTLTHLFPQESFPFPRTEIWAEWAAEIADPDIEAFVVEHHPAGVVGFAALRGIEVLHFGMAVETWGSGLAATALGLLVTRLARTGADRAWLHVFEDNHRARRFYEKAGWRSTDRSTRSAFEPFPVLMEYEVDLGRRRHAGP